MTRIQLQNDGYDVAVNGKIVVADARTKDSAFEQAGAIHEAFRLAGVAAVIVNMQGVAL